MGACCVYPSNATKKDLTASDGKFAFTNSAALQFVLVMLRFPFPVSAKRFQTAIVGAVGVAREEQARRLIEPHGHPHLLQDEIALKIIARRGQGFCSTSDDDDVRPQDSLPPEKFVHRQTNALSEAA